MKTRLRQLANNFTFKIIFGVMLILFSQNSSSIEPIPTSCPKDPSVEYSDGCSGNTTCVQIMAALDQNYEPSLTCPQIADHVANRLGYGISTADTIQIKNYTRAHVRNLILRVANAINGNVPMTRSPELQEKMNSIAPEINMPDDQYLAKRNGLTDKISLLEEQMLEMTARDVTYCKTYPNDEYCKAEAEHDAAQSDLQKLVGDLYIKNSFQRFKALRATLGSQYYDQNGKVRDSQENLNEVLLEFWFNRFNIDIHKAGKFARGPSGIEFTIFSKQYSTFKDLLTSVITHPAMLYYLDNQTNTFDPTTELPGNQNLGRELLELHTLGVGPTTDNFVSPYTQNDVVNASLILTGMKPVLATKSYGAFFDATTHIPPDLTVGQTKHLLPNPKVMNKEYPFIWTDYGKNSSHPTLLDVSKNGQLTELLKDLARHSYTRESICGQLSAFFVRDPILAKASKSKCISAYGLDGELKKMYTAIFTDPGFWNPKNYRNSVQNPTEFAASMARKTGVDLKDLEVATAGTTSFTTHLAVIVVDAAELLGLEMRAFSAPTGYPLNGNTWLSKGYLNAAVINSFDVMNLHMRYSSSATDGISEILSNSPPSSGSDTDRVLYDVWALPVELSTNQINSCSKLTQNSTSINIYTGNVPARMQNIRTIEEFLAASSVGIQK